MKDAKIKLLELENFALWAMQLILLVLTRNYSYKRENEIETEREIDVFLRNWLM